MKKNNDYQNFANLTDNEARAMLEKIRWPEGAVCPHCGAIDPYKLTPKASSKSGVREGVYKCSACRKQFTVTVGTIFEGSKVKLGKWLAVIHLACSSKKGISAHQIHRMFGITYKTAWFMMHRIRFAMSAPDGQVFSGIVEADETYVGGKGKGKRGRGSVKKTPVFSLLERDGSVKSKVVEHVTAKNLQSAIYESVDRNSIICTDEFKSYKGLDKGFKAHKVVNHSIEQYVDGIAYTNSVEGFFSILKRGINGIYQHVSKHHLQNYLSEFDFRYNHRKISDAERTFEALKGFEGKRLLYKALA